MHNSSVFHTSRSFIPASTIPVVPAASEASLDIPVLYQHDF
jgi:hypothetical protein